MTFSLLTLTLTQSRSGERRAGGGQQCQLQQHPHPFNSYGVKAEDSQVDRGTGTQRDTLKQFHLHFSLRLDRRPGYGRIGTDRTGQERSCSLTVSGFMLPPCNVIKNMFASARQGLGQGTSGKWQVASCEWRTLGKVSWQQSHNVNTPSSLLSPVITARRGQSTPPSSNHSHSVPGQRREPVCALPLYLSWPQVE